MSDIIVLGSINMDMVVLTPRFPEAGETLSGNDFKLVPGGKGANQAVAACRAGASTLFIGCVGEDPFGDALLHSMNDSGIETKHIRLLKNIPTGTATIIVEQNGENRIIIVPGANGKVNHADVDQHKSLFALAKYLLLQFEIPLETVFYAIESARAAGCKVILNPAPAYPIPERIYPYIDFLVLNENEISQLTNQPVNDVKSALAASHDLFKKGVGHIIVTLGSQGAVSITPDGNLYLPALPVKVVDTTAAGDSFVGAFAAALVQSFSPQTAVKFAVAAGSLAVTRLGAQPSIPTREEIQKAVSDSTGYQPGKEGE